MTLQTVFLSIETPDFLKLNNSSQVIKFCVVSPLSTVKPRLFEVSGTARFSSNYR